MSFPVNKAYEEKIVAWSDPVSYPCPVGRKKRWSEDMQARFPAGTFERIEAVIKEDEDRTDFVREAVEREIKRRQKGKKR